MSKLISIFKIDGWRLNYDPFIGASIHYDPVFVGFVSSRIVWHVFIAFSREAGDTTVLLVKGVYKIG